MSWVRDGSSIEVTEDTRCIVGQWEGGWRCRGVCRSGPMIRMALTHAVHRGLAASVHANWRRGDCGGGGGGD